jgi:hypothetical protein
MVFTVGVEFTARPVRPAYTQQLDASRSHFSLELPSALSTRVQFACPILRLVEPMPRLISMAIASNEVCPSSVALVFACLSSIYALPRHTPEIRAS